MPEGVVIRNSVHIEDSHYIHLDSFRTVGNYISVSDPGRILFFLLGSIGVLVTGVELCNLIKSGSNLYTIFFSYFKKQFSSDNPC